MNFDKLILKTINEVQFWQKLSGTVTIPNHINQILAKKEHYRQMREMIMVIVREYNLIINSIGDEFWPLFHEHLHKLDEDIKKGLINLNWNQSNLEGSYIQNCKSACSRTQYIVRTFQGNHKAIYETCNKISRTILSNIGKELYYLKVFMKQQEEVFKENESKLLA
jgi:dynein heavy chain, axonemal